MSVVKIPFKPYFEEPMLSGVKTCTARTKYLGHSGDTFEAFGAVFTLIEVNEVYLYEVAALWKEEGCTSREHFQEVWTDIHPRLGYDDWILVKLHRFRKVQP